MFYASTIQFKAEYGNPSRNREALLRLCSEAARRESGLIVLPELCLTGYVWPRRDMIEILAEPARGESFQAFSAFCRENGCYLAYGYAEKDPASDDLFNSQNLIGPGGVLLATYRKVHLFDLDYFWAKPGDAGFISVDTSLGRLGLGICMDLNYDDFIEFHETSNTDWLLFSTNWLEQGIDVHAYWARRFSGFSGSAFLSNTFGFEYDIEFCGQSSVFESGRFIAEGPRENNAIIITGHQQRRERIVAG